MPAEFDIYGVYIPRLLVLILLTLLISFVVRRALAWVGVYNFVWHRALFDLALYVILLGAVSSFTGWYFA